MNSLRSIPVLLAVLLAANFASAQLLLRGDGGTGGTGGSSGVTPPMTSATIMNARSTGSRIVKAQDAGKSTNILGSQSYSYALPLFSLAGRGLNLDLTLYYNSQLWVFNGSNNSMVLAADFNTPAPGFTLHYGLVQFSSDKSFGVFYDATGFRHLFFPTATTNLYETQDSTYIQVQYPSTSGGPATVTFSNGIKLTCQPFTVLANNTTEYRTSQIEDNNGNFISISYINNNDLRINQITDTIGRIIQFNYNSSGLLATVAQLYSNGTVFRQYAFSLSPLTVNFNFTLKATTGLGLTPGYLTSGQSSVNVLTKVTKPDNTSVSFDYAHDVNGVNPDNPDWVIVKSISELSSNGTTRYSTSYLFPRASAGVLTSNPTYTQQSVNDGQNKGTWAYQSVTNTNGLVTSSVATDPCGTTDTTTFSANGDSLDGLPIQEVLSYNPPSPLSAGCSNVAQNNLRTINTVWALDTAGANPRITSTTEVLEDGSTQSQVACSTFDSFGQCTDTLQYDFGANQPGPLVMETLASYASPINNIVNLISDLQVKNGSGAVLFHKKFNYDEIAVANTASSPVQHDSAYSTSFTARGNLTSTVEYANAANNSGGITTNFTYDLAGNMLTAKQGSGALSQWNFSSATQYAYPDSIAAGPSGSQITSTLTYDMDRARVSSITDPNGQKTSFGWDVDSRPASVTTPQSVVVSAAYDDAAASPAVTKSNSATSLVTKVTADGRGRPLTQQTLSGTSLVSTISTSYNILGRLLQNSNPYGPSDTIQNTVYTYDNLGRVVAATPPAISTGAQNPYQIQFGLTSFSDAAGNQHIGPMTTLTDPAGKLRRQYQDVFGRLLRLDEPGVSGGAAGVGSAAISGTEQSVSVSSGGGATAGTGSVTITGTDRSTPVLTHPATQSSAVITITGAEQYAQICQWDGLECVYYTAQDTGTLTLTVNGYSITGEFGGGGGSGMDATTEASYFAGIINSDPNAPITATSVSGPNITIVSKATGSSSNYTLSSSAADNDPADFGCCSFAISTPASMTGGTNNGYTTTYDTGTVTVNLTINGTAYSKQSNYGQTSTGATIASDLAGKINADTTLNKLIVANAASGSNILNLTTTATGASTAYPLSASAVTSSQYFASGSSSYSTTTSGSSLTPGKNGTIYDAGTVSIAISGFTTNPVTYTANYSQGSTTASIASALSGAINADSFAPVMATVANGSSVVTLTARSPGSDTNYGVAVKSATSQGTYFSQASFSGTGSALTGGANPVASLSTPLSTYYSYDATGNVLQITQGQQTRTFSYDSLGRMLSSVTPETAYQTTTYSYTDFGAISQIIDPRIIPGTSTHIAITYGYDNYNRLASIGHNDTTPGVTYTYNSPGSANNTGARLATVKVSSGSSTLESDSYQYDTIGRPTQVTKMIGGISYPISYKYNLDGTLASITYPSGRVVSSSYDSIGRLSQVGMNGSMMLSIQSFNAAGEVLATSYSNGMSGTYTYNNQLQPSSLLIGSSSSPALNLAFNYGGAQDNNQIQGITDNLVSSRSTAYTYDELGRLKFAQTNDLTSANTWKLKFTYDRYGSRLSEIPVAGTASMPMNEVLVDPTTNRINQSGYIYDAAGDLTSDGLNNYVFDAERRLTSVSPVPGFPGNPATFAYDADGLRINKNGTIYLYSGNKPIAEYNSGAVPGSPNVEYIYAGGARIASVAGSATTYYYPDLLSTRVLSDSTGKQIGTAGLYPFGEVWYQTGTTSKWLFTTYEGDRGTGESGLDYATARFYSSRLGRFTSRDPIGGSAFDPQSLNRYSYVGNDPINEFDPDGLMPCYFVAGINTPPGSKDSLLADYNIQPGIYTYGHGDKVGGMADVMGRDLGFGGDDIGAAATALKNQINPANPNVIFGYSGGAQVVSSAVSSGLLNIKDSNIAITIFISPGTGVFSSLPKGTNGRVIVHGEGLADIGATLAQNIFHGKHGDGLSCSHGDLACFLSKLRTLILIFCGTHVEPDPPKITPIELIPVPLEGGSEFDGPDNNTDDNPDCPNGDCHPEPVVCPSDPGGCTHPCLRDRDGNCISELREPKTEFLADLEDWEARQKKLSASISSRGRERAFLGRFTNMELSK
jgi:RHS repeat-associated protein